MAMLCNFFPELIGKETNHELFHEIKNGNVALPAGAEGFFVIPPWSKIGSTYQTALEKVLKALEQAPNGHPINCQQNELDPHKLLCETPKKARMMEALQQSQNADILIVPAQLGLLHRYKSVRRARALMSGMEFGLGVYEIGIILLTHPNRLQDWESLRIDCAGDEYSLDVGGDFPNIPLFLYSAGNLCLQQFRLNYAAVENGSASGFATPLSVIPSQ